MSGQPSLPQPRFIAGHLALDFANTVGSRDYVPDAAALVQWGQLAQVLDEPDTERILSIIEADVVVGHSLTRDMHRLRKAIFEAGSAHVAQLAIPQDARDSLLEIGQKTLAVARLEHASSQRLGLQFDRSPSSMLLGPVAWSAIDLFRHGADYPLKQCPPHDCRWLFLDKSRNQSRIWCDMSDCGARAKLERRSERNDASSDHLVSRDRGRTRLIPFGKITAIRAAGNYAEVHLNGAVELVSSPLAALARTLPNDQFARVHRSWIVRLDQVRTVRPMSHGDATAEMEDGMTIPVSRRLREQLDVYLGRR